MNNSVKGISIPFRINPASGGVATQDNEFDKLKENIIHILLTAIGERPMRHDYGAGLRQLIHDPNNDALKVIVQRQLANSISRWEPRVMLQAVTVRQHEGTLYAELQYIIRQTQQAQRLSIPIGSSGI